MRIGVVGTDIMHSLEYAGIINAKANDEPAKPQITHGREAAAGGEAVHPAEEVPKVTTGRMIREDPVFEGMHVVAWYDEDKVAASEMAKRADVPEVVDTLEQLIDEVDAALVCTHDGATHHRLSMPFLSAGKPVFIDKPLCENVDEAVELVDVARANDTFFFSSSPWKWTPAVERVVEATGAIGTVRTVVATGPAPLGTYFYNIHMAELCQRFLGSGARQVQTLDDAERHFTTIEYDNGAVAVINGLRGTRWMRHVTVYGEDGFDQAVITNAQRDEGMVRMMRAFTKGLKEGKPPVPMSWAEEMIRVLSAADFAAREGERAPVAVAHR